MEPPTWVLTGDRFGLPLDYRLDYEPLRYVSSQVRQQFPAQMSQYSPDIDHVIGQLRLVLETLVDLRRRSPEALVGDGWLRLRFGRPLDYALAVTSCCWSRWPSR